MATLYPSCGANAREVRGAKVNAFSVRELKRLLVAQNILAISLPSGGGLLVYDRDAGVKRLNVNKRGTLIMRQQLKDSSVASGVLRGPVVLLTVTERIVEVEETL